MSQILLGYPTDSHMDRQALHAMFRLRHKVFYERLGWEVEVQQGMEKDRYDDLSPIYMIARGRAPDVDGCWRLLPTTGPYMLKDTFPELLRGEPAPECSRVWELSRFAVKPSAADDCRQVNFGAVTFTMMQRVFDFAEQQGIGQYVTVTSVALERLLRKVGIPLRRFGDGQAMRIGKTLSVACWIDINEQCRRVNQDLLDTQERRAAA